MAAISMERAKRTVMEATTWFAASFSFMWLRRMVRSSDIVLSQKDPGRVGTRRAGRNPVWCGAGKRKTPRGRMLDRRMPPPLLDVRGVTLQYKTRDHLVTATYR